MQSRILPICLVLILLAIGAFGFLVFESMDHGENHKCPIPASGSDCPIVNSLSLTLHHLSGLQYLSQSTNIGLSALIVLSMASIFFLLAELLRRIQSGPALSYQKHRKILNFIIKPKKKFLRWFAMHNKGDSHILNWVCEVYSRKFTFPKAA